MMNLNPALIIDDEDDICFLLGKVLRDKNYKVNIANNLNDGLEMIHKIKPSILFLDVRLPDGSGLDSLQLIRKQNPSLRIVMMSAYDEAHERVQAIESGADLFIAKPLNMELINHALRTIKPDPANNI